MPIVFTAAQLAASAAAGDARSQASFWGDTDAWHAYQDEWFATVMMGEKLPALEDANRSKRWKAARRQRGKIEEQRPHIDDRQARAASGELAAARSEAKYEQMRKQRRDGGQEYRDAENLARSQAREAVKLREKETVATSRNPYILTTEELAQELEQQRALFVLLLDEAGVEEPEQFVVEDEMLRDLLGPADRPVAPRRTIHNIRTSMNDYWLSMHQDDLKSLGLERRRFEVGPVDLRWKAPHEVLRGPRSFVEPGYLTARLRRCDTYDKSRLRPALLLEEVDNMIDVCDRWLKLMEKTPRWDSCTYFGWTDCGNSVHPDFFDWYQDMRLPECESYDPLPLWFEQESDWARISSADCCVFTGAREPVSSSVRAGEIERERQRERDERYRLDRP